MWRLIDGRVISDTVKDVYDQFDSEDEDTMILREVVKSPSKDGATNLFIHLFNHLFIHPFIHSFIYSFIRSFIHSITHYVVSLRQVHSIFQTEFSKDCDPGFPL